MPGKDGKGGAVHRVIDVVDTAYVMMADSDNSMFIPEPMRCVDYLAAYDAVLPGRYDGHHNAMHLLRRVMGVTFKLFVKDSRSISVDNSDAATNCSGQNSSRIQ